MHLASNPLLNGYMSFGQFDLFETSNFLRRKRSLVNLLIKLLIFFNASKTLTILLNECLGRNLKAYLIDFYVFQDAEQKLLDLGLSFVHIGFCSGFLYWSDLNEKVNTLESFRFLLIRHAKDRHRFGQHYGLNRTSTDKFFAAYRLACLFLRAIMVLYYFFISATILRCLVVSFYHVSFLYFLSVSLPLSVITFVGYILMALYASSKFILVLLSTEFLILRVKAINRLICSRFSRTDPASIRRPMKLRKQKLPIREILYFLNDFCRQFKEVNSVLDKSLSPGWCGGFTALFFVPYSLVFVETALGLRLALLTMMVAIYLFCSLTSICNDRLRRQVGESRLS